MQEAAVQVAAVSAFDDPAMWEVPSYVSPLPATEVLALQKEINSITGLTRDNRPIAKLVWNGDVKFWKDICFEWDSNGEPIRFLKRPHVLYRTVFNSIGKFVRDEFPPRWLILTRIEPEQYAATWERDAFVYDPQFGKRIQVKPSTPPDEWHVWWMTIADHDDFCCKKAAEADVSCYGRYAHPRRGIEEIRQARKGMESKTDISSPFDSPDSLTRKMREQSVNNYIEQSLKHYRQQSLSFIEALPYKDVRSALTEGMNRDLDDMEKQKRSEIR